MRKMLLSIILCAFFLGCQTAGGLNRINLGMTKAQVLSALGSPNRTTVTGTGEVLDYMYPRATLTKIPYSNAEQYWVFLENDRVIKYGPAGSFISADERVALIQANATQNQAQVLAQGLASLSSQTQQPNQQQQFWQQQQQNSQQLALQRSAQSGQLLQGAMTGGRSYQNQTNCTTQYVGNQAYTTCN